MEIMRGEGCAVGEYVGEGQGESESVTKETTTSTDLDFDTVDADPEVDQSCDEDDDSGDDEETHPLLIFYDCETTGFSIYKDNITDIAAMVVASPVPVPNPTFSSLVKTSRSIPSAGMV